MVPCNIKAMLCYSSGFTGLVRLKVIVAEKLLQALESGGALVMGVLRLQHLLARGLRRVFTCLREVRGMRPLPHRSSAGAWCVM